MVKEFGVCQRPEAALRSSSKTEGGGRVWGGRRATVRGATDAKRKGQKAMEWGRQRSQPPQELGLRCRSKEEAIRGHEAERLLERRRYGV